MKLITRDELRIRIARGDKLKLAMTMPELAYCAKHIPHSFEADLKIIAARPGMRGDETPIGIEQRELCFRAAAVDAKEQSLAHEFLMTRLSLAFALPI